MGNTALGAKKAIIFNSGVHEKCYYEKMEEAKELGVCEKAIEYDLCMNHDTRMNIDIIYDFKLGNIKTECLHEDRQTSENVKVVKMVCILCSVYFWQAVKIRYPEYALYNYKLNAMFGGQDRC